MTSSAKLAAERKAPPSAAWGGLLVGVCGQQGETDVGNRNFGDVKRDEAGILNKDDGDSIGGSSHHNWPC